LWNVLDGGRILVDNDHYVRADFLENYGLKFRECEGLSFRRYWHEGRSHSHQELFV
jgi:hypothetical protein